MITEKSKQPVAKRFDEERPAVRQRISRALRLGSLRTRLLVAFVLLVLLPSVAISTVTAVVSFRNGLQQVFNQLESVATLKEAEVEAFVNSLKSNLVIALSGQTTMQHVKVLLEEEPADPEDYREAHTELRTRFQQITKPTGQFDELFIMDLRGRVVLSNDISQEGRIYGYLPYFQEGLKGEHVYPPFKHQSLDQVSVFAVRPIKDEQQQVLGVMAGRASMARLSEIMLERAGLGQTGETYLVRSNYTMLTESRFVEKEDIYVRTKGVEAAVGTRGNGYGMYADYRDVPIIEVYHWLPDLQAVLVAKQDQSEAFGAAYRTLAINVGVGLASVLLAVVASLFAARGITAPITQLIKVTDRISMGDLDVAVGVTSKGEIGDLAQSIERMRISLKAALERLRRKA
jgi:nitrogen fixation/metabolism regulation signal transduction histidine kinase